MVFTVTGITYLEEEEEVIIILVSRIVANDYLNENLVLPNLKYYLSSNASINIQFVD